LALAEASDIAAAQRASGSSFYNAMRVLPRAQREAMFEIYSFCRQVDDIADSSAPCSERREQLQRWRADIDALYAGRPVPRTRGLVAPDEATLDTYCNRVASAVGRLSVRVFGMEEQDGIALAHHLGRALQLTNILRDIDEDAAFGRLYLPKEALQEAGINTTDPMAVLASPMLGAVCARIVERAREHFAQADKVMARSPRRCVRAPRIMGEAYRLILDSLVARGWSHPRRPIRLPRSRLLWIIMRHAVI
jgi:presqualene diphosphate synthase